MEDTSCSLYVNANTDVRNFVDMLCSYLGGKEEVLSSISCSRYEIDVDENDEFDIHKQKSFPDGSVYFRYIVNVEFLESELLEYAVEEISKILKWMWSHNFSAVASWDYEDLLPEKGGYNSQNIPWPGKDDML